MHTRFMPFDAARSLYGHLLVQWSPFLPQMRHTSSEALLFAMAASGSESFSISLFACARAAPKQTVPPRAKSLSKVSAQTSNVRAGTGWEKETYPSELLPGGSEKATRRRTAL